MKIYVCGLGQVCRVKNFHRGVAAVDRDHAAAGVGAGSAEEDAGHRRPGLSRRSHM